MSSPTSSVARLRVRKVEAERRARRQQRTPAAVPAAPIVKWAGGKGRLLDELLARRPATYRRYFEPFFGGGALFFRMAPPHAVVADLNDDLINMYRCVAWHVQGVIERLERHRAAHGEEHYYETRSRWNDRDRALSKVDRAAMFIYLNKTCYNGLWRVNSKGLFNVPMGRYANPTVFDPQALRAASRLLQRADLRTSDFRAVVDDAASGDFVYFDPPYAPLSETANFTSYTADSFGPDDQRELATIARDLAHRGCAVMVSNHDTPFIRRLYSGFKITRVDCTRAINSNADKRGAVGELIIANEL